ncbi:MAG: hypothetical protein KKA07_18515 [Bacteroidetes bacterium]|nr:hypothetical protein [Bacteroidota bacterium]MBU1721066.1 hypothetical protein [Bacteroidota bacterium]
MKFLSKSRDSKILSSGITYQEGRAENNLKLRQHLLAEQKNFCAYTEKFIEGLDSCEVEHFDSSKKYNDNYFNYYAVIRKANQYKKDEQYQDASFFETLFFQNKQEFAARIQYLSEGVYEETDEKDTEAAELIDFLGFNNPVLSDERKNHIRRLKNIFSVAKFSKEKQKEYLLNHKRELSFITAIEVELGINLSKFYE